MPLEAAVRKLAALPAENLGIKRRGRLQAGYFADIAIFDAGIQDQATFEKPRQYATGMVHVFVNGVQVLKNGEHTGAKPGRVVRGQGWKGEESDSFMPDLTRRRLLAALPALGTAVAWPFEGAVSGQVGSSPIRIRESLNHFEIAVADPKRTVEFYQGLFGMPVQARTGSATILRVGAGRQFLSIRPVESNTTPRITHYSLGLEDFTVNRIFDNARCARRGEGGCGRADEGERHEARRQLELIVRGS